MSGDTALVAVLGAVALAVLVVALVGWLSWTAARLDRLDRRCHGAAAALEAALAERRSQTLELSGQPSTDPATAVLLVAAATRERSADDWQAESDLSAVLRAVEPELSTSEAWSELRSVAQRVSLARRIHNDLVVTASALRDRRRVRWFRLGRHVTLPKTVSFDDEPPRSP